jgi:hypothetical protein
MSTSRRLKKSQGDAVHAAVKAALSIIPVVGGPLTELFAYVIEEPVSKRRDAWISEIAGRLENLRSQLGDDFIEQLRENPRFATARSKPIKLQFEITSGKKLKRWPMQS